MEDIQFKLEQYRREKRKKQEGFRNRFKRFIMLKQMDEDSTTNINKVNDETLETQLQPLLSDGDDTLSVSDSSENLRVQPTPTSGNGNKILEYVLRIIYFLVWITLFIIAIELKFGIVYGMLSALVGIYLNTRTGPKRKDEISAYSVFNKNCESIDGTLKAEHFEKQLFHNPNLQPT